MKTYTVTDTWAPENNSPWEFTGDKGETVRLITYWLTLDEKDGPTGIRARIHMKPDSEAPKKGDILTGELIQKTSKAGKDYLQFKRSQAWMVECPGCGNQFDAKQHKVDAQKEIPLANKPGKSVVQDDEPPLENYDEII